MDKSSGKKGLFLVTTGAVFWGISGSVSQKLFQQTAVDIDWLVTTRLLIAGVLLLAVQWLAKDRSQLFVVWKNKKTALQLVAFGLLGMLAVQYTYMASIKYGNAAVATLLQYLALSHDYHLFNSAKTNGFHAKGFADRPPRFSRLFLLVDRRLRFPIIRA